MSEIRKSDRSHVVLWGKEVSTKFVFLRPLGLRLTLPGKDGVQKMKDIMAAMRNDPPKAIGSLKVTAVRDYLAQKKTTADGSEPIDLPKSDVLYFELENGNWICVRPSGTEPKIKLYVNTRADSEEAAQSLNEELKAAAQKLVGA